jgi:5'-deoxynucleotidase YfbR-like HD superfamily hydrolase
MKLLVDEVVESWEKGGIRTSRSGVEVLDTVLRSLDGTARFNATTEKRHSVLVHSWFVGIMAAEFAPDEMKDTARLIGMVHDFGETVVGDFVLPVKSGRVFGEVYRRYYEPLEAAFRSFVGEKVLNINDFDAKFKSVWEYVRRADEYVGELELYGDTLELDGEAERHVEMLFDEMDESVGIGLFRDTLLELAKTA